MMFVIHEAFQELKVVVQSKQLGIKEDVDRERKQAMEAVEVNWWWRRWKRNQKLLTTERKSTMKIEVPMRGKKVVEVFYKMDDVSIEYVLVDLEEDYY